MPISDFEAMPVNNAGHIVSTAMTKFGTGARASHKASFSSRSEVALEEAEVHLHIQVQRSNGIKDRLDRFVQQGIAKEFASLGSNSDRTVVHANISEQ